MFTKKVFIVSILTILLATGAVFYIRKNYLPTPQELTGPEQNHVLPNTTQKPVTTQTPTPNLKSALLLKVPFTPQAPTANWNALHNEACEEASAIMVHEYFSGNTQTNLAPALVEDELSKLTKWETDTFGYYLDISTEEIVQLLQQEYGLQTKIITNPSEQDVQEELALDHLIIWPAQGQLLGNPNFRGEGPPYHVVVVKGYSNNSIITNDPGTKRGLNYSYPFSVLQKANGDFDHDTGKVNIHKKEVIAVWKK